VRAACDAVVFRGFDVDASTEGGKKVFRFPWDSRGAAVAEAVALARRRPNGAAPGAAIELARD
jgi:hypothetical protein